MKTGFHGEEYSDDGIVFEVLDEFNTQFVARVGPLFRGNNISPEKVVWIEMGDEEIVLSEDTFKALVKHINKRFSDWKVFEETK